ncbi:hypothetical protein AXK56_16375 [Tsukamurella pulmonis]|uniref:DUF8175 domain-containing protein n=1 Tax=Tsukamurella pulmonis TaxID=47312 RepID=A0A1H1A8A8_9ACTN|nr:hypothetical protein [Tsukamurella pulmonis]KXO95787.1 hypothetical protein AXK56_16375 [Tsukamurella pulmonis]SDQ35576.1 hypothetical protein SAMN04489765_0088 [Tsukamurella pulmonis]SUQ39450.1 Uncharacterised protein [Tsukamurella pulmonis]
MKRRPALAAAAGVLCVAAIGTAVHLNQASTGPAALDLAAPPTNVRWVTFQGMQIPEANEGPHNASAVAPTGYDRSPAGAALAAINATVRMSVADRDQWPDVSRLNLAPGPGRERFAVNRVQVSMDRPVAPGDAERVIGYRVRAFNEAGANVDIFTEAPDTSKLVTFTQVAWTHNQDWGLVVASAADHDNRKVAITTTPADAVLLPRPDTKGAP